MQAESDFGGGGWIWTCWIRTRSTRLAEPPACRSFLCPFLVLFDDSVSFTEQGTILGSWNLLNKWTLHLFRGP